MAPGWLHNYVCSVAEVPAPCRPGRDHSGSKWPNVGGHTSPLALTTTPSPARRTGWSRRLIAKWGVDQLIKTASRSAWERTPSSSSKQPDGTFHPAGQLHRRAAQNQLRLLASEPTPTRSNSTLWAPDRIADPYNQALTLTYDSSNRVVHRNRLEGADR